MIIRDSIAWADLRLSFGARPFVAQLGPAAAHPASRLARYTGKVVNRGDITYTVAEYDKKFQVSTSAVCAFSAHRMLGCKTDGIGKLGVG